MKSCNREQFFMEMEKYYRKQDIKQVLIFENKFQKLEIEYTIDVEEEIHTLYVTALNKPENFSENEDRFVSMYAFGFKE